MQHVGLRQAYCYRDTTEQLNLHTAAQLSGICIGCSKTGMLPCRYCQRLDSPKFWGGEVELLVLSKMVSTPIYIYRTAQEAGLDAK